MNPNEDDIKKDFNTIFADGKSRLQYANNSIYRTLSKVCEICDSNNHESDKCKVGSYIQDLRNNHNKLQKRVQDLENNHNRGNANTQRQVDTNWLMNNSSNFSFIN
jgi:hypothetical protein